MLIIIKIVNVPPQKIRRNLNQIRSVWVLAVPTQIIGGTFEKLWGALPPPLGGAV